MKRNDMMLEAQFEELLDESAGSVTDRERSTFDELAAPFGDAIVLFGAGNLGKKTLRGLRKVGKEPLAFADNSERLWGTLVEGIPVLSPADAARRYSHTAVFVSTIWRAMGGDRQANRFRQLQALGCRKVISFGYLFWKYPDIFLPHGCLDLPHRTYEHKDELRRFFYCLGDDSSRREFLAQLRFRLLLDFDGLPEPAIHKQYFPDDLFSFSADEVFVDCGAFDGDTIREFLSRQSSFKRIFAIEPDTINFSKLEGYASTLGSSFREKMTLLKAAAADREGKVRFSATGTVASTITENGDVEVDCVVLDHVLDECPPTFIKMDIEGAEIDALVGARNTIKGALPLLAICVYHRPDHLWRVPLFIKSQSDDYRFFLRPHDFEGWDLVCYSVPVARLKSQRVL